MDTFDKKVDSPPHKKPFSPSGVDDVAVGSALSSLSDDMTTLKSEIEREAEEQHINVIQKYELTNMELFKSGSQGMNGSSPCLSVLVCVFGVMTGRKRVLSMFMLMVGYVYLKYLLPYCVL